MMKKTIIAEHRVSLDERLLSTLKAIGIVTSKTGLSQLCGKTDSYFACMKKRGYGIHLGSLVFLSAKLSVQMNEEPDVRERAKLRSAVKAINEAIQQKCRLREMEIAGR